MDVVRARVASEGAKEVRGVKADAVASLSFNICGGLSAGGGVGGGVAGTAGGGTVAGGLEAEGLGAGGTMGADEVAGAGMGAGAAAGTGVFPPPRSVKGTSMFGSICCFTCPLGSCITSSGILGTI